MIRFFVQQTGTPADPLLTLVQYGALGLVVIALLVGWLWPRPSVQQLIKDKERAEQQRDELMATYEQRILPILSQYADAAARQSQSIETVLRALRDNDDDGYGRTRR